jgi:hypothetical protein
MVARGQQRDVGGNHQLLELEHDSRSGSTSY